MPIKEYYGGRGELVMRRMQRKYGAKKGKQVFYATANKEGQKPAKRKSAGRAGSGKRR